MRTQARSYVVLLNQASLLFIINYIASSRCRATEG